MVFDHVQFTEPEIQKAFNLLEKEGLIGKISKIKANALELLGEGARYDITDEDLKQFIKDCWRELFSGVHFRMMFTWKLFRSPSREERKWYKTLWGPKRASNFFSDYKRNGKQELNMSKKEFDDKTCIARFDKFIPKELKRICNEYHDIIGKYPYPSMMLLELVYPPFLREVHNNTVDYTQLV